MGSYTPGPLPPLLPAMSTYREWLVKTDYESSQAYDKAVMTLSGGALAISMAFIRDVVPSPLKNTLWLLIAAWSSFAFSILTILVSLLSSQWALRKAVSQVDAGTIRKERPSAWFAWFTTTLNIAACVTFIIGVAFLVAFSVRNMLFGGQSSGNESGPFFLP